MSKKSALTPAIAPTFASCLLSAIPCATTGGWPRSSLTPLWPRSAVSR